MMTISISSIFQKSSNTVEALTEIEETTGDKMEGSFNPNDLRDLQVLLDQPQKHVTPFETYISYRVTCKVAQMAWEYMMIILKPFTSCSADHEDRV